MPRKERIRGSTGHVTSGNPHRRLQSPAAACAHGHDQEWSTPDRWRRCTNTDFHHPLLVAVVARWQRRNSPGGRWSDDQSGHADQCRARSNICRLSPDGCLHDFRIRPQIPKDSLPFSGGIIDCVGLKRTFTRAISLAGPPHEGLKVCAAPTGRDVGTTDLGIGYARRFGSVIHQIFVFLNYVRKEIRDVFRR